MNRIATECACRLTRESLREGQKDLVILTNALDSDAVRRAIGTVMPQGSTSTGAVWVSPNGQSISVKRYADQRPDYKGHISLQVCNGGRVITKQEAQHVERWYQGGRAPISFVGA